MAAARLRQRVGMAAVTAHDATRRQSGTPRRSSPQPRSGLPRPAWTTGAHGHYIQPVQAAGKAATVRTGDADTGGVALGKPSFWQRPSQHGHRTTDTYRQHENGWVPRAHVDIAKSHSTHPDRKARGSIHLGEGRVTRSGNPGDQHVTTITHVYTPLSPQSAVPDLANNPAVT